jgi:hypothetical protein
MTLMVTSRAALRIVLKCAHFLTCIYVLAMGQVWAQNTLRAHSEVLGADDAPFSFPEKAIVGPDRNIYFLDTSLSSIFVQDFKTKNIKRLCGPESLRSPSDMSIDTRGQLWVLHNGGAKIARLNAQCAVQTEISAPKLSLKIATNTFGELIILNETGPFLFGLFNEQGKLLRSFGERINYNDEVTTNELSDGRIVPDNNGGFFFSFNYPPLIRHYSRSGRLLGEFKPESDIAIGPPNIMVRKLGNAVSISSKYQILVLDLAVDSQGRLYVLLSGKNKVPALNEGTARLVVSTSEGRILKTVTLDRSFHRVLINKGNVYLLRNRPPFRLDKYVVL